MTEKCIGSETRRRVPWNALGLAWMRECCTGTLHPEWIQGHHGRGTWSSISVPGVRSSKYLKTGLTDSSQEESARGKGVQSTAKGDRGAAHRAQSRGIGHSQAARGAQPGSQGSTLLVPPPVSPPCCGHGPWHVPRSSSMDCQSLSRPPKRKNKPDSATSHTCRGRGLQAWCRCLWKECAAVECHQGSEVP